LAEVLLSRVPQVVSARRGLIIEGGAKFGGAEILYRAALLPLSEDGGTIDHVLGAASYRPLEVGESLTRQVLFSDALALSGGFQAPSRPRTK